MENTLVKNRDIIMFGLQPWDIEIGSNFKNMALEIARHNRVLYVNRPLDRISYLKNRKDRKISARIKSYKIGKSELTQINENLQILNPSAILESINWIPEGRVYNYFNKINNKRLAGEIRKASDGLNYNQPILIIDNDFFNALYLKEFLKLYCVIFYIRDYLRSQPYFCRHGKLSEPALIEKADIVVTNSAYLCNYAKKYNINSHYIGQGCDVEDFLKDDYPMPDDLNSIKKPLIGYCGNLTTARLNLVLLEELAAKRPFWNFVLVGPQDKLFKASILNNMSNVYFLGSKLASELPAYIYYFDVCINPQSVNEMTIGNYPRKIDEYLAAGKPVVATATETMQEFKDFTYLCNTTADYILAIETALEERGDKEQKQKRSSFAQSHTWQASINEMYIAINNLK